jgi:hypothetical protein
MWVISHQNLRPWHWNHPIKGYWLAILTKSHIRPHVKIQKNTNPDFQWIKLEKSFFGFLKDLYICKHNVILVNFVDKKRSSNLLSSLFFKPPTFKKHIFKEVDECNGTITNFHKVLHPSLDFWKTYIFVWFIIHLWHHHIPRGSTMIFWNV